MTREWTAICKDCGKKFGYSDASIRADETRGFSRPERCPNCRRLHSREIRTLGLSHYELRPVRASVVTTGVQPGLLGGLKHPPRDHRAKRLRSRLDPGKFGIKDEDIKKLFAALRLPECQVAIITGPTGSGKSTFLPYRLIVPPEDMEDPEQFTRHGQIVVTQPRQAATWGIASYVAETLHGSKTAGAGYDIGFKYHNAPATDRRNRLVYVTDGTLINWIVRGQLSNLSVIMIDEVHERNLNIDLILGLLKTQLPRYSHLKLIIASATISEDVKDRFISHFGGGKRVAFLPFEGERVHPVKEHYHEGEPIPMGAMPAAVADKIVWLLREMASDRGALPLGKGDILAFLHGVRQIEEAIEQVRDAVEEDANLAGRVNVYPLHARLSRREQKKALAKRTDPRRMRVVVATNIAETSLTVDGIIYVVDSGLIKQTRWDPRAQTDVLVSTFHSQSGCIQRWGRAGRIEPGEAYCLYSQEQFKSFDPDTKPEIKRAPLEQIVLKAKAAGIDNIFKFDWFEAPDEVELRRSQRVLRKWGALDDDGDLTEHGLELHWIPEEPYLANLMVVADRLACAVEMATVLPMMKLGGRRGLLLWGRGWDAATKHAVSRIHRSLAEGCQDDLEFCLKLYAAWEGSPEDENYNRAAWARHFFVNERTMRKVAQERDNLLRSLSVHKKSIKTRPIDFDLLDRVRIVFATSLPERIYYRDAVGLPPDGRSALVYRPKFPADESLADVTVEISQNSVCYGRLPELIVCGNTRVFSKRTTPRAEPERVIDGSFLVRTRPEWLEHVGSSTLAVAGLISRETRGADGTLRASDDQLRLFLDQWFPLGACYNCRLVPGDTLEGMLRVDIEDRVSAPPRMRIFSREGEVELEDELDKILPAGDRDDLGTLPPEVVGKVHQKARKKAPLDPEADEMPTWIEFADEDDELPEFPEPVSYLALRDKVGRPLGLVPANALDPESGPSFVAEVIGYAFDDHVGPTVLLRPPIEPEPFAVFAKTHQVGDTVWVKALAVETFPNDHLVALLVREEGSGLEVVMEPEDLTIISRGFAVEAIQPGQRFQVVVETLDLKRRRVRLSRLPLVEEDLLTLMGTSTELTLPARIAEVRDNGICVHLDPENIRDGIVHGAFVHINRLPHRPEASLLGKGCRVKIRLDPKHKTHRGLPLVPEGLVELVDQQHWGTHITCDVEQKTLAIEGRITYAERTELLELSENVGYRRAVNILYKRSNEPYVAKFIDFERLVQIEEEFEKNPEVIRSVTGVTNFGVFVKIDEDIDGLVRRNELPFSGKTSPEDYSVGEEVAVIGKGVNPEEGQVALSMRRPEDDPLLKYDVGQRVNGVVNRVESYGVFVKLEPGVEGRAHISKLAWAYVDDPSEVASIGQVVEVKLLGIDREERQIDLDMRPTAKHVRQKYPAGKWFEGTATRLEPYGAFVQLEPGLVGLVHIREMAQGYVRSPGDVVRVGQRVKVRLLDIDSAKRQLSLSMKLEKPKSECFLATHLYGSDSMEVAILQHFRDEVLLQSMLLSTIVSLYYWASPIIIRWFGDNKLFMYISLVLMNRIIKIVRLNDTDG